MFAAAVEERSRRAKAEGRAYLLVCFDTFDRLRGDEDLGYYYPTFDTVAEVASRLEGLQFGEWNPSDGSDFCEAVVDLRDWDGKSLARFVSAPLDWLAARTGGRNTPA